MIVVGIDTDAKGSVAILDCRNASNPVLDVYGIPNRQKVLTSGKKRLGVNFPALAAIMAELTSRVYVTRFYLEEQWSRPQQGSGAAFTFGQTFGDIRTSVAAALIGDFPPHEVDTMIKFIPALDWKSAMRLSKDKDLSLALADKLFPECKKAWAKKSLYTSAAEAALLAFYGASLEGFKLPAGAVVSAPKIPMLEVASSLVINGG